MFMSMKIININHRIEFLPNRTLECTDFDGIGISGSGMND
jgi:hypothetical protein